MRIVFIPYTDGVSNSVTALRTTLRGFGETTKRIDRDYRRRRDDVFINWGNGTRDWGRHLDTPHIANPVTTPATNKLHTFNHFKQYNERNRDKLNLLTFFTSQRDAREWMRQTGQSVVCRTILTGREGAGIVLADDPAQLEDAPLYVEYKKKKKEYRVHVFDAEIIDVVQKKKRRGSQANARIRNANAGWVFAREGINPLPDDLINQATKAINALALDFGAVDVLYNEREDKCYAIEVNTAPGIEGQTVEKYARAIATYANR